AVAQHRTLSRLVRQLAPGRFGQAHGLDELVGLSPGVLADRYRQKVPLRDFEALRAFIEPSPADLAGAPPLCLLRTSASTGRPKLIPYTSAFREAIARAHDVFSAAMFRDFPALPLSPGSSPRALGLYQLSTTEEVALG